MIILIPLGGIGQRFKENGYNKPKALVNVFGKSIISYVLDNLNIEEIDYIYIPYNKEYQHYHFEDTIKKQYSHIPFKFYCMENNTRGAAETINISLNQLEEKRDVPIICLDADNFYLCNIISKWKGENVVFTFKDVNKNPIYSYVECNNDEEIINIKEKEKISNKACTGAYGFKSIQTLKKYTLKIIEKNIRQQNEFYTSGVIKEMINDNYIIKNITINRSEYICLGTPLQLKLFYNNFPRVNSIDNKIKIQPKRICFDLDNTLVSFPTISDDYTSVVPIVNNIDFLRYLKKLGNIIIIYTARRMKTHNGNIGKINKDIGKITFDTLDKFDIPYDEIYFGKPYADFYIDDLAVNSFENLEKETGFYNNIIKPRDFHSIEESSVNIITKTGKLDGEIYYYENIPKPIKDLFPLYFGSNMNSLSIEYINGISVSDLYLSKLLTTDMLINILNSIVRIHELECDDTRYNIYGNYANKLKKRYAEYDYSSFTKSDIIYKELLNELTEYEVNKLGKIKIIHGDPVFTNIIINNYGKIKFIDMRGKIDDKLTITGDWLYDWAKLYQSLIGYDEILLSKEIDDIDYKTNIINCFTQYFIDKYSINDFNKLQIITKSLLFTLIPLHNNEKCVKYYNLIFSNHITKCSN